MASVKRTVTFHNHHRTWLPLALIGAAFLIIMAIAAAPKRGPRVIPPPDQTATTQEMKANYQTQLRAALAAYDASGARDALLQTLLTVRVPADYLNAHVSLVVAADDVDFSADGLKTQIASMRQEYAWLQ